MKGKFEKRDKEKVIKKKHILKSKGKKDDILIETAEKNNVIQSIEENIEDDKATEVKKKEVSKRKLKKERAEHRTSEAREANQQLIAQKALNYISKWKYMRSEWKFEKLKQIWLIDNLLDDKYVSNKNFVTILEYFERCKGLARKQLLNKAMKVIKNTEDKIENDKELLETIEYKRARELLQALPIET